MQFDQWVLGVEGDFDGANIEGDRDFSDVRIDGTVKLKSNWQASLRARAASLGRFLIYATGGVAFANAKLSVDGDIGGTSFDESDSSTLTGWTAGGGVEYAFTDNIIGRAEVRYSDFGKDTFDLGAGDVKAGFDQTAVIFGVSYKF